MDKLPILTFENEIYYYILAWQKTDKCYQWLDHGKRRFLYLYFCPQIENCC